MTPHRHWFKEYKPFVVPIRLADGKVIHSAGIGSVLFSPLVRGCKGPEVEFTRVLHVPHLNSNLLSVLYLTCHKRFRVTIVNDTVYFNRNRELYFTATVPASSNLAILDGQVIPMTHFAGRVSTCPSDLTLWHRRLSHLNIGDVKRLISGEMVTGIMLESQTMPDPICEPCIAGKQHRHVAKEATYHSSGLLDLIHTDLHGPLPVATPEGYKYWVTFTDDKSRHWATLLLKQKSEAFPAFKRSRHGLRSRLDSKSKLFAMTKEGNGCLLCNAHILRNMALSFNTLFAPNPTRTVWQSVPIAPWQSMLQQSSQKHTFLPLSGGMQSKHTPMFTIDPPHLQCS